MISTFSGERGLNSPRFCVITRATIVFIHIWAEKCANYRNQSGSERNRIKSARDNMVITIDLALVYIVLLLFPGRWKNSDTRTRP